MTNKAAAAESTEPIQKKPSFSRVAYTGEFKKSAVRLVLTKGLTITQAARHLGIPPQTLRNWVKLREAGEKLAPTHAKVDADEMEIQMLKAENLRLRKEVALIKKFNELIEAQKF